jgi:predicted nuclease of predicted toxin-antitoxin system
MIRFLVDAQLPRRLSEWLKGCGYDAIHTLELPEKNRSRDWQINLLSIEEHRVVISKDNDFLESLLISEKPYKLLLVNTGNIANRQLMEIFEKHIDLIVRSLEENRLVEITEEKLIVHE